ncbi:MAG: PfkB family carbohydrate kinase [Devosia sp.]
MTGAVLCVGALSLDTIFRLDTLPTAPGKYLPTDAIEIAQGMATAQAATIVRLGGKARLWTSCGDDAIGDRIVDDLTAAGIDLSVLCRVTGARSGFSSIFMDKSGQQIVVPRYDPAIRTAPEAAPSLDDIAVVSVDVRWPDAAEMALRAARGRGIPGLLDVEIAPEDVLTRLLPLATHIIASEAGALKLSGMAPEAAVEAIGKRCNAIVAVTTGERGVFWSGGHIPALAVEAVDTLAAGDVFHGAFAFGLAESWELERNLRFASVAAALKCTRFGGRLGAPTRAEVEALL